LKEAVEKKQPTKLSDETLAAVVYGGDHSPWVHMRFALLAHHFATRAFLHLTVRA
jgi:hypothetical protein